MEYPRLEITSKNDSKVITIDKERLMTVSNKEGGGFGTENCGYAALRNSSPNGLNGKGIYLSDSADWIIVKEGSATVLLPLKKENNNE